MNTTTNSIILTNVYFKVLLEKVEEQFILKHTIKKLPKTFQYFGYGAFNENKPNLKKDFEAISNEVINGKYLYDKWRDFEKGKLNIKLNAHYSSIILLYIGYSSFKTFFSEHQLSEIETEKQKALLGNQDTNTSYYYINYYFGEDNTIIKGQTIISNNWKKIQHIFLYPLEDGSIGQHHSHGTIKRHNETIYINTKTLTNGRYVDRSSEIYYMGLKSFSSINYLIGTYCNFDFYNNTVAGRSILEKCENKAIMEEKSNNPNIPAYIALEIRNKRITNKKGVPKHFLELSNRSPFASLYNKLPGVYELVFTLNNKTFETLKFKMLATNFQIITLTENVYIEKDRIDLLNKGSVINFRFTFSGIIALERVDVYFKTYYLKNESGTQKGVFSGIDNENRLVNGTLLVRYKNN